jgi:hypothetical protein
MVQGITRGGERREAMPRPREHRVGAAFARPHAELRLRHAGLERSHRFSGDFVDRPTLEQRPETIRQRRRVVRSELVSEAVDHDGAMRHDA